MKAAKLIVAVLSLLLFTVGLARAQDGRQAAEREAEAGGWQVAYGNELTEQEMEQGEVQPGVSIFAARGTQEMMVLHDWANALIQQAANSAGIRNLDQEEQFQAMRFTVRTVRELIRSKQPGVQQRELNSVAMKVGLLQYRDRGRGRWGHVFVPYVGMRTQMGRGGSPWEQKNDYHPEQSYVPEVPPTVQSPHQYGGATGWHERNSAEIMNAFTLNNTSRSIGGGRWQWTAYIAGPAQYLDRIRSVSYYLHPSFKPSVQQGDSSRKGHPLTATGWGVFLLRAEVSLDDGTRRIYEHMLRLK